MTKLYILLAVSIVLAYLYENTYVPTLNGPKRPKYLYVALVAVLICFNGFRGEYNDTWTYRDAYVHLVKGFPEAWEHLSWDLGDNPGFELIQSWFKTYNTDVHLLLMFFGFWTVLFDMQFIKRYSINLVFGVYLFFTTGCYVFTLAAIKQCMAVAICLMAIPYANDRKWGRFLLLVLFSSLFHPYSLLYLIVPFMYFRPWTKASYVLLAIIVAGGLLLEPLLGTVVDITAALGKEYSENSFRGEGISIIRLLACAAPVILSFAYRREIFRDSTREQHLFVNLSMIYAGILFVGLFGNPMYFSRLALYFAIMPVIALPWMLSKINPRYRQLITAVAVVGYFGYFYYTHAIETHFDSSYSALTLQQFWHYLYEALSGGAA